MPSDEVCTCEDRDSGRSGQVRKAAAIASIHDHREARRVKGHWNVIARSIQVKRIHESCCVIHAGIFTRSFDRSSRQSEGSTVYAPDQFPPLRKNASQGLRSAWRSANAASISAAAGLPAFSSDAPLPASLVTSSPRQSPVIMACTKAS